MSVRREVTDPRQRRAPELCPVTMADASVSQVRIFAAGGGGCAEGAAGGSSAAAAGSSDAEPKPLVMIWPGFGVGARYYDPIAWELADRGFPVATGELRGQGNSTARAGRRQAWGYHDMASGDYPRSMIAAKKRLGLSNDHPTVLLCHSMGGQIGSLFLARNEARSGNVVGMMGVGAGSPFYRGFEGKTRLRLRFGTYLILVNLALYGYQPAGWRDFVGYGRQARHHLREWFRYAHTDKLDRLAGQDMDYTAARRKVGVPVLLTRMENDGDCPVASAEYLARALPKAFPRVEELPGGLGHNRWAREPQVVADRLVEFLRQIGRLA